jgi:hypothetical protein
MKKIPTEEVSLYSFEIVIRLEKKDRAAYSKNM